MVWKALQKSKQTTALPFSQQTRYLIVEGNEFGQLLPVTLLSLMYLSAFQDDFLCQFPEGRTELRVIGL